MALADEFLELASQLSSADWGQLGPAYPRRAISSAYYALFHLLADEGAGLVGSALSPAAKARLRRAYNHGDMKLVCSQYAKAATPASFRPQLAALLEFPVTQGLRNVAEAFVYLQEARHLADYDGAHTYNRADARVYVDLARAAFSDWEIAKSTANAKIFLTDLLIHKAWMRN